jgi:hypothetical protein
MLVIGGCLLIVSPSFANGSKNNFQGYGTGYVRSSCEQTAVEKAHMRRNAGLYNQQLIKMWKLTGSKGGVSRISFLTDRVGNMFDLKVEHSSGNSTIDKAALKAVVAMVPMSDFGGESAVNYSFESTFSVSGVTTEYKGCKSFDPPVHDELLEKRQR